MSKSTEFHDVDGHAVDIESRADRKAWAIKFLGVTYREFDKDDAPALALAILEAAGVESCPYDSATSVQIALGNLREHVGIESAKAKAAADREALEKDALELANAWREAHDCEPFPTWDSVTNPGGFLALARKSREIHGSKS